MARNLMLDAIAGYNAVDNIFRREREDKALAEDRAFQQEVRNRQKTQWGAEDELKAADEEAAKQFLNDPIAMKKVEQFTSDPDKAAEALHVSDQIMEIINSGKLPPQDMVANYLNYAAAPELEDRAMSQGLKGLAVRDIVPSPNGQGVMINFDAIDENGKKYQAPMTEKASRDTKDNVVKELSMQQLMDWFGGSVETLRKVAIAEAKAGNPRILNKYRQLVEENRKTIAAREQKQQDEQRTIEQKKELLKWEWENKPKEKKELKTQVIETEAGQILINSAGEEIARFGRKPKSGKGIEVPASLQAKWNEDAKNQAKEEASKKAGLWRSDKTDFPEGKQKWIDDRAMEIFTGRVKDYISSVYGQEATGAPQSTGPTPAAAGGMTPGQASQQPTPEVEPGPQEKSSHTGELKKVEPGTKLDRTTAIMIRAQAGSKVEAEKMAKDLGYDVETSEQPKAGEAGAATINREKKSAPAKKGVSLSKEDQAKINKMAGPDKYSMPVSDHKALKKLFSSAKSVADMTVDEMKVFAKHIQKEVKTGLPDIAKAFKEQDWPKLRAVLLAFERDASRNKPSKPEYKAGGRTY